MSITDETIAKVRSALMAMTGLSCLSYAVLAIISNKPDPVWWFVPGTVGAVAGLGTALVFALASPEARRMANDEMYRHITHRAQRHAFWVALSLYPVFAIAVIAFGLDWRVVFAAQGTLTGAAYLLLLNFYEWRS